MLVKLPSVGEMAAVGHIAPQLHLLLLKAVLHSNYNSHSTCITEGQRQVLLGLTFSPDNPQSGQPKQAPAKENHHQQGSLIRGSSEQAKTKHSMLNAYK